MDLPSALFVVWIAVTLLAAPVLLKGCWETVVLSGLNVMAFLSQIRKLMSAGNRPRAIKLCNAAPHLPYLRLVRHALELRVAPMDPLGAEPNSYRAGPAGQTLEVRAREALRQQAIIELVPVDLWWRRTLMGATPVVLVSIPLLVVRVGPLAVILAGLAVALGVAGYVTLRRETMYRSMEFCVDALTPYVLAEGGSDDAGDNGSGFSAEPT